MDRRTLLASVGAAGLLGGGVGYGACRYLHAPVAPGPATDVSFVIVDDQLGEPGDEPSIEFDEDNDVIHVSGTLYVGPPDCHEASLRSIGYDSESDSISTSVSWTRIWSAYLDGCSDEVGPDSYRLTIAVDRFPRRVVAVEHDVFGNRYSTQHP